MRCRLVVCGCAASWWWGDDISLRLEEALAHVGHRQGRRARYRGTRKNLFDLRCVAVVHNVHVIARQPAARDYQLTA